MADILEFMNNREQWIEERYELVRERLDSLVSENKTGLFREEYLTGMALFLRDALRVYDFKMAQILDGLPLEEQKGIHDQLYHAPVWNQYGSSVHDCEEAEEKWSLLLWAAAREWQLAAGYACGGQRFLLVACVELFLQIYQLFEMERNNEITRDELWEAIRQALYYHFSDYCDVTAALSYHNLLIPDSFTEQIVNASSQDRYGLYRLGGPVDRTAQNRSVIMAAYTQQELDRCARLLLESVPASADNVCSCIAVIVPVGTERLARAVCRQLSNASCKPVCLRRQETLMARACDGRPVVELPLFWDRALKERRLSEEKNALDAYKLPLKRLAAVIDLEDIYPRMNLPDTDAIPLFSSPRQQRLFTDFLSEIQGLRTAAFSDVRSITDIPDSVRNFNLT